MEKEDVYGWLDKLQVKQDVLENHITAIDDNITRITENLTIISDILTMMNDKINAIHFEEKYSGFRKNVCSKCDDAETCDQSENDIEDCIDAMTPLMRV